MLDGTKDILDLAASGKIDEAVQKMLGFKNLSNQIDFLKQLAVDVSQTYGITQESQELITLLDQGSRRRDNFRVQLIYLHKSQELAASTLNPDHWQSNLLVTSLNQLIEKLEKKQKPKVFSHVEEVKPDEATPPASDSASKVFKAFQFTGIGTLSPQTLVKQLAPYLQALADLQQILCEHKNEPCPEPHIYSIREDAPVRVDINGITQAVQMVLNVIIPYRRQNAKKLAQYAVISEQIEIQKSRQADLHQELISGQIKNDKLESETEIEQERYRLETRLILTEIERQQLESRKLEIEKQQLEIFIGQELIAQILPDLSENEEAVSRLTTILTRLASSRIEPLPQ